MKKVSDLDFHVECAEGLVLVDFYADWCGPCRALKPVLLELSQEMEDVKFVAVDVDESPSLVREFGVTAMPTVYLIKDGKQVAMFRGGRQKEYVKDMIMEHK